MGTSPRVSRWPAAGGKQQLLTQCMQRLQNIPPPITRRESRYLSFHRTCRTLATEPRTSHPPCTTAPPPHPALASPAGPSQLPCTHPCLPPILLCRVFPFLALPHPIPGAARGPGGRPQEKPRCPHLDGRLLARSPGVWHFVMAACHDRDPDICTPTSAAPSFTIAAEWKQPMRASMGEQRDKLWSNHTAKYSTCDPWASCMIPRLRTPQRPEARRWLPGAEGGLGVSSGVRTSGRVLEPGLVH